MSDEKQESRLLSSIMYTYYRKGLVCETEDVKLSSGEFAVLQLLRDEQQRRLLIGELTEKLQTTQPAVSQIVKRMEKKELIRKEVSREDKRNVYVCPTERGSELFDYFFGNSCSFTERVIRRMEPEHGKELLHLLEEFSRCAEEEVREGN